MLRPQLVKTSQRISKRFFSNIQGFDSLVVGAYASETPVLTTKQVSAKTRELIQSQLALSNFKKPGDVRVFYNVGGIKQVAVVSLGDKKKLKTDNDEQESVRMAVRKQHHNAFNYNLTLILNRLLSVFRHFKSKALHAPALTFL